MGLGIEMILEQDSSPRRVMVLLKLDQMKA